MITIVSGTNRPGSNTRKVASVVEAIYRDMGIETCLLDLLDLPPGLFAPESYAAKPAAFSAFSDGVLHADGVVVVTPEYNGSMPGVLKLFIDHLKFPDCFEGRPFCFVGLAAGMWGGLRSVEQLQAIFGYRNGFLFPNRVFMPNVNRLLDANGQFIGPDIPKRLKDQAERFVGFVEALRGETVHRF